VSSGHPSGSISDPFIGDGLLLHVHQRAPERVQEWFASILQEGRNVIARGNDINTV
jgi:hypothetical protein